MGFFIMSYQHERKIGDEKSVIEEEYELYKKELSTNKLSTNKTKEEKEIITEAGNLGENDVLYDTQYVIEIFDAITDSKKESTEILPAKYIGLNRSQLEKELDLYNKAPTLRDQEKGFVSARLMNFSSEEIVVRKIFSLPEPSNYYLAVKENFIVVYEDDQSTIFLNSSISLEELPEDLQIEIMNMKFMETEEDVYDFLESHTS